MSGPTWTPADIAPRRGRPPKGARAMTAVERNAAYRAKAVQLTAGECALLAFIVQSYRNQLKGDGDAAVRKRLGALLDTLGIGRRVVIPGDAGLSADLPGLPDGRLFP